MPTDFGREDFETSELVFAGASVGVLIDDLRADDLAKTYHFEKDGLGNLLGTAAKSCGRTLTKDDQPATDMGVVSATAHEPAAFRAKLFSPANS